MSDSSATFSHHACKLTLTNKMTVPRKQTIQPSVTRLRKAYLILTLILQPDRFVANLCLLHCKKCQ